jgi:uncharacterized membrane protein YfcA
MVTTIVILCLAAFVAGFVDAIVGGGGLIQLPVALITLPNDAVSTVIGTLKIPSFSGTVFAFVQYARRVAIKWKITALMCALAFIFSYTGSYLQTMVSNAFMKPVLLVILTGIAIYTYTKKDLGDKKRESLPEKKLLLYSASISVVIGLYDGFIGPGAGSFLILAFISLLHFDFMEASAHAKVVNLATNFGSIILFFYKGKIMWIYAIPMAICNALGALLGSRLAMIRGNKFIRVFFLIVVIGTLLRFSYDVFLKN